MKSTITFHPLRASYPVVTAKLDDGGAAFSTKSAWYINVQTTEFSSYGYRFKSAHDWIRRIARLQRQIALIDFKESEAKQEKVLRKASELGFILPEVKLKNVS